MGPNKAESLACSGCPNWRKKRADSRGKLCLSPHLPRSQPRTRRVVFVSVGSQSRVQSRGQGGSRGLPKGSYCKLGRLLEGSESTSEPSSSLWMVLLSVDGTSCMNEVQKNLCRASLLHEQASDKSSQCCSVLGRQGLRYI